SGNREATPATAQASTLLLEPPAPPVRAITARLVNVKVGRRKVLMVRVIYADTGEVKREVASPFQPPTFKNVQASVRDRDGDGVNDVIVLMARKGRRAVTATFPG